ncbi:syntaxin protein [Rhizoctonia solani AG-3 Rhs1AP]|uniref:Syntaxin protein n=1 Tax=Rhizoctonia solani AG-3 Rhs1AP TaxID=1086054 RepID=X8JBK7_9AGAM|nr:syntaxin protein [Rhizoctonia solani AG-3 Rhs1AP]
MATDRLAARRAERAQQYQQPPESPQYPMNAYPPQSNTDSTYGANGYGNGNGNGNGATAETEMTRFYDEITAIQDLIHSYRDNITRISNLHSRSLTVTDDESLRQSTGELDAIGSQTHDLSSQIKQRIQTLEANRGKVQGRDKDAWIQQTNVVKTRFVAAIQEYQQAEQQYRQRSRQRVERQVRIVKPDATQQEIDSVVNNDQGAQVLGQALMSSNRYGESALPIVKYKPDTTISRKLRKR